MFLDECLPTTECLNVPLDVDERDGARSCILHTCTFRTFFFYKKKLYISSNHANFLSFNDDDMEPSKRRCFYISLIFGLKWISLSKARQTIYTSTVLSKRPNTAIVGQRPF